MSAKRKIRRNILKNECYARGGNNMVFHRAWHLYQEKKYGPYKRLRNEFIGTHKKRTWSSRLSLVPENDRNLY